MSIFIFLLQRHGLYIDDLASHDLAYDFLMLANWHLNSERGLLDKIYTLQQLLADKSHVAQQMLR